MKDDNKKTILLVEDDVLIALSEKDSIEKHNYKVIIVSAGEKAIEIVDSNPEIDLILMDIDLGEGIDGTETAAKILKNHDIPIVFLSSHTESEIVEKTETITSYGYVVKNSSITVLDASIKMAFKLFYAYKKEMQKELALRENEKRLRQIIDLVPHFIFVKDIDGRFILVNDANARAYGTTADNLIGKQDSDFNPNKSEVEHFLRDDKSVIESGVSMFNIEESFTDSNGNVRLLETTKIPFTASGTNSHSVLGIAVDITDRQRADCFIQNIIDKNPMSIQIIDKDGFTIKVNPAFIELFGSMPPKDYSIFTDNQLAKQNVKDIFDRLRRGENVQFPDIFFNAHDSLPEQPDVSVWVKTIGFTLNDSNFSKEKFVLMHENITKRKNAEKAIKDSEEKFNLMLKNSNDAFVLINSKSEQFYISDAATRDTGFSVEELKGPIINVIYPDDVHLILKAWNEVLSNKDELIRVQYRHKHKFKEYIWYEAVAQNFLDHPAINAVIVNVRDITEQKRLENNIQNQLQEKTILLKEVHHRIKNNIASIEALLSMQMKSINNKESISALQDAIGRISSMRVLYDKLLLSENYKNISIKTYIESLIDIIIALFPNNLQISINKTIDDFKLFPKDLFSLGIILNELITNIMKYAFINNESGLINISLEKKDNKVTLIIYDNGRGFPEDFKINESKGFGLMLVKMLTEQLEGTFTIENHNGTRRILEFNA